MKIKRCSTCTAWNAENGYCYYKMDFMEGDDYCPSYKRNVCQQCGGTLDARSNGTEAWAHCFSCNFDYMITYMWRKKDEIHNQDRGWEPV